VSVQGGQGVHGITEADIANYLANTPGFFERHAELLASIQLANPHGQRAVSLQERQMQMLRERIRGLEMRIIEMIRAGQENMGHADRLHRYTLALLAGAAPGTLAEVLMHEFMIPQAALRLWSVKPEHAGAPFAAPVSDDVKTFAASLAQPYCGANAGFEAAGWLADAGAMRSLAMIPLRSLPGAAGDGEAPFGLLVLGSPDPTRYTADMGTEFLERLGELTGAALVRYRAEGA